MERAAPAAVAQRLGELLLERGALQRAELDRALAFQDAQAGQGGHGGQSGQGGRLGAVLVRMGALSEETLYQALAAQLALPLHTLDAADEVRWLGGLEALGWPPGWWAERQALPLAEVDGDGSGPLTIAAADPLDGDLREAVDARRGTRRVTWVLALPAQIERWHQQQRDRDGPAGGELDARTLRELAEDAPVIAFVNNVLAQAVEARASDIHLEPGEREFAVRLRIDGVLHTRMSLPIARYAAVASRVKLVSGLDIAERRLPQDGRTSIRVAGAEMDVRVSAIPAVHGESLVLRLLPKQRADLRLDRLGMADDQLAMFRRWLNWSNGLVLVTGPTGSGKSTTLYGALAALSGAGDLSRKIVTVEDPVEYRLPHVVQIQTQAEIGYTFGRALRSILRHDPDIIMVGEIRDRETAEIAVQSALTGHLVLATIHTNDALSAVTRLVDMGIEPYLVAAALKATMAQRLVRRLCEACAGPRLAEPTVAARHAALAARLGHTASAAPPRWRHAVGCAACGGTGWRGRLGIYELVELNAGMQHLIASAAPAAELVRAADAAGRRSLVEDGLLKTAAGQTGFDEVLRVCGGAED